MSMDVGSSATSLEDAFRQAWATLPDPSTFAGRMARQSLEMSAQQHPGLTTVLQELQTSPLAELDLHLEGEGVDGHATNALQFAEFVRGIAEAVKEVTKTALGRARMASTLQIYAPAPGSVRVVLRPAPETASRPKDVAERESQSLVLIAGFLARDSSPDKDVPLEAHAGLRRAAKAVAKAGWNVEGTLTRPGDASLQKLQVNPESAERLIEELDERSEKTDELTVRGIIDGQRRSNGRMWFAPRGAETFEASVDDEAKLQDIAAWSATARPVIASFNVTTKSGENGTVRRSYSLIRVSPIDEDRPTRAVERRIK